MPLSVGYWRAHTTISTLWRRKLERLLLQIMLPSSHLQHHSNRMDLFKVHYHCMNFLYVSEWRTCKTGESKVSKREGNFKIEMEKITGFLGAEGTHMCLGMNCSLMRCPSGPDSFQKPWWRSKHAKLLAVSKTNVNWMQLLQGTDKLHLCVLSKTSIIFVYR